MRSVPHDLRILARGRDGRAVLALPGDDGRPVGIEHMDLDELPGRLAAVERAEHPRWVWSDARDHLPRLLAAGVTVERCHDLRLVHQILVHAASVSSDDRAALLAAAAWAVPIAEATAPEQEGAAALFDLEATGRPDQVPADLDETCAELSRQLRAIDGAQDPSRLRLLAAAESSGAIIACELRAAGIPWDVAEHERILVENLGPRPSPGAAPARMAELAAEVREALGDPLLSLDSPPRLLRALHRAGIDVSSTSKWELEGISHPAIAPLLAYKRLSRLLTANGWAWIGGWVRDGRYRPVYVPGGVVTGRWASSGGGALQIPRLLRPALRADPGWTLVSADVSQLEPRVLAAMSRDGEMARAGRGTDLYAGIVAAGVVATRQEAKVGVLGALYGGTSGDSGRIVPRLREVFPDAMRLVDRAAEIGEVGGTVSTWLGRSTPPADERWSAAQRAAHQVDATSTEQERARRSARDRGRFTRNFIVQGTAAEWALAWMALLRQELAAFEPVAPELAASGSGPLFSRRAHLAFFLHDEVIVHAPLYQAEAAAAAIRDAADQAGRLLFPGTGVDFPLDLAIRERAVKD